MKKINYLIMSILMAFAIVSCNEDILNTTGDPSLQTNDPSSGVQALTVATTTPAYCGLPTTWTLWAGQTIDAGTLTVGNDGTNLYVTYTTTGVFGTLHLWAGTDLTLLPKNSQGTPVPGQFPYVIDATGLTTYTFTIPLANIASYVKCGDKIYVVAHAEVTINGNNETAFGGDIAGTGTNRWYFYALYTTQCCDPNPPTPSENLGTAFAKGGYVFTTDKKSNPENLPSLSLTKNRWGWAINLKSVGSYTFDVYVGAGLNYTSKGLFVGTAKVDFNGTQAVVTYNMNPTFTVEEAHVYAGDFKPTTVAPGQYGNTYYFNPFVGTFTETYDVTDTNGDGVWFILHSVVYGPGVTNVI